MSATMPLDRARLCLDCEILFEDRVCPACGSGAWVLVARFLSVRDTTCGAIAVREFTSTRW
jgi:RNA polymerase subunit RPABC4/transcription elongation factor Spt4